MASIIPASVQAKRGWSATLTTVGLALLALAMTPGVPIPGGFSLVGAGMVLIAVLVSMEADQQQDAHARAADIVKWKREEQRFRRAVGKIWRRLEGPFSDYAGAVGTDRSFREVVANAGWPNDRGETAEILSGYCEECLPPNRARLFDSAIAPLARGAFVERVRNRGEGLVKEWEDVKDILEIWTAAFDLGEGEGDVLREIVRGLRDSHEDSIRLMWFLSIAHTAYVAVTDEPDYTFVRRVRDVMLD